MPTNAVSVAATGLPTRRLALVTLAGAGAVLGLPSAAGASSAAAFQDVELIAHANRVEALAARTDHVLSEIIRIDAKVCALKPARPSTPTALEAWQDECDAIERDSGLHAAQRLSYRLDERLTKAARELVSMTPGTQQGLAAKVKASTAVFEAYADGVIPKWLQALVASTFHDTLAIGGAA